jgi:MFS family permease
MDQPVIRLSTPHLLLAYFTGTFGFGFQQMAAFLLPLRMHELHAPTEQIGLIVGAGALIPALLSVQSGELSDRLGARMTYQIGTVVSAAMAFLMFFVTDYWYFFPIQLIMGFARSTAWIASQAYVTNIGTDAERPTHTSRLSFTTSAGTIIAPLVIGLVADQLGFQNAFLFMGGFTVMYTLLALLMPDVRVRQTSKKRGAGGGMGTAIALMRTRGMQVVLMLTFVRLWNGSGWRPFFPIFMTELGFGPSLISTVLAANSVVSMVAALWAPWLAKKTSNEVATAIALGLGAIGTAISPWVASVPLVYLPALLIGTGVGISLPLLMASVSSEVPADQRGVALGLRMSLNQAAGAGAPLVVGAIAAPFGAAAIGVPIALVASGAFSLVLLGGSMALYASNRRAGIQVDQPVVT